MHPLQEDVTVLKDQELDDKIRDLSKKLLMASRFPNQSVLQQIQMMLTTYKQEQSRRSRCSNSTHSLAMIPNPAPLPRRHIDIFT